MKIWIDDLRPAPEGWTWVKTPAEAIALLEQGGVEAISFDHDLGIFENGRELTGYTLACWIEEQVIVNGFTPPATLTVHSANSAGRRNLLAAFDSIARHSQAQSQARSHDHDLGL